MIVFRTDASSEIGTGHVARCLTLADRLRARGKAFQFVCRDHDGIARRWLTELGVAVHWLPAPTGPHPSTTAHGAWLGVPEEDDARALLEAVGPDVEWVVVDHYGISATWETRVREALRCRVAVIDDLADRPHGCDLLLDQTLQPDGRYAGLVPPAARLYIGPEYALLRPEFDTASPTPRHGDIRRILVAFGGTDRYGLCAMALEAFAQLGWADVSFDLIAGRAHPDLDLLRRLSADIPGVALHGTVDDVARRMASSDLALGAAGMMSWERCAMGLPSLSVTVAANQVEIGRALAEQGAARDLGPAGSLDRQRLIEAFRDLRAHPEALRYMSARALELHVGRSSSAVIDDIIDSSRAR